MKELNYITPLQGRYKEHDSIGHLRQRLLRNIEYLLCFFLDYLK